MIYKLHVSQLYDTRTSDNPSCTQSKGSSDQHHDEPFAIQHVNLCVRSRVLAVTTLSNAVIVYRFRSKETASVIFVCPTLFIPFHYDSILPLVLVTVDVVASKCNSLLPDHMQHEDLGWNPYIFLVLWPDLWTSVLFYYCASSDFNLLLLKNPNQLNHGWFSKDFFDQMDSTSSTDLSFPRSLSLFKGPTSIFLPIQRMQLLLCSMIFLSKC